MIIAIELLELGGTAWANHTVVAAGAQVRCLARGVGVPLVQYYCVLTGTTTTR
jgi:hypothetical protein